MGLNTSLAPSSDSSRGFTLVELLVGITVSSILLIALFQLLSNLTTVLSSYREQSLHTHREVALRRLLYQDLYSVPATKVKFKGTGEEFFRTTVTRGTQEDMLMETRVHYFTRREGDQLNLMRAWKWVDLHEDYGDPTVLLSANSISFRYITESAETVRTTAGTSEKIKGLQLKIDDSTITVPAGTKSSGDDSQDSSRATRGGN